MSRRLCRAPVRGIVRRKLIVLPIYAGLLAGTVWIADACRAASSRMLDQGYAIVVASSCPTAPRSSRTDAVTKRVSEIALQTPGVAHAVAFAGFSGATFTNASNAAAVFVAVQAVRGAR